MLVPTDLVRLAELIKLSAETAKVFCDAAADGETSKITDAAGRIIAAADELIEAGRTLERRRYT